MGLGMEPLDFGPLFADPRNHAFADARGGFFFHGLAGGRYELHTVFGPAVRGRAALDLAANVIRRMFVETDCLEIVTRVPGNLRHAGLMARKAGFRERWTMAKGWPGPDGERVSLRLFGLILDDWAQQDPALLAEGEAFHGLLRQAADAAGDTGPLHPHEDDVHERIAGMASLMARAGNHPKALWAYNRWAFLAGYRPLQLIAEDPATYDTGNAHVAVRGGELEIVNWSPQLS